MSRRGKNEGSVYQRKDGRWVGQVTFWHGGKRQRRSFYGVTREEAAKKLRKGQNTTDDNLPFTPENLTVSAHLTMWLAEKKKTLRPESWRRYDDLSRLYIVPEIGHVRLAKLAVTHVQGLHNALAQRVSGTTCQHAHGVLHAALQDALRWGVVSRNVASLVTAPRRSTGEMRFLGPEDARDLLVAAKGDPLEALYALALTTGLREGELQALRWSNVDLDRRQVRVIATLTAVKDGSPVFGEPKTQHSKRTVYLSEVAVEALEAHCAQQDFQRCRVGSAWEDFGLVFTRELGQPLTRGYIRNRSFKKLLTKAALPDMRFHDLRHSAASLLLAEGTPVRLVSEMLGHSDVKTTLSIYAHVIPGMQEQAASAMDRLFHA